MKTKILIHPEDLNNQNYVKFMQDVSVSIEELEKFCRKEVLSDDFDGWDYQASHEGFDIHFFQEDASSPHEIIIYLDNGEHDTYVDLVIPDLKIKEIDKNFDINNFVESFSEEASSFIQTKTKTIQERLKVIFGQPSSIEQLRELDKLQTLQRSVDDLQEAAYEI